MSPTGPAAMRGLTWCASGSGGVLAAATGAVALLLAEPDVLVVAVGCRRLDVGDLARLVRAVNG